MFGRGPLHAAGALLALAAGTWQARAHAAPARRRVVVGFGGYPAVAPVLAARLLRRRPGIILHDQNAVLGRANRLLARAADTLALSHAATAHVPEGVATLLTGNPVRPAVLDAAGLDYEPPAQELRLLVLGGSLGARVFSDVVPAALAAAARRVAGAAARHPAMPARGSGAGAHRVCGYRHQGRAGPFFSAVASLLEQAHLVISRGGGSTVAELAAVGRPAIIVPLPIAIDDDQAANARALVEAGGAWMVRQPDFTPDALARRIACAGAPRRRCWRRPRGRRLARHRRRRRAARRPRANRPIAQEFAA